MNAQPYSIDYINYQPIQVRFGLQQEIDSWGTCLHFLLNKQIKALANFFPVCTLQKTFNSVLNKTLVSKGKPLNNEFLMTRRETSESNLDSVARYVQSTPPATTIRCLIGSRDRYRAVSGK